MNFFRPAVFVLSKIVFCPFIIAAQVSNQSTSLAADRYVSVDGHKMHYQTAGGGRATVVFENGHGDNLFEWDDIFFDVAKFAKVVRYDRMGYDRSEATNQARTLKQIATELHSMLHRANIAPPYILVGHSMGGAIIRAFAYLYKDETAGFVFVDPFNEFETNGMGKKEIENELNSADSMLRPGPPNIFEEFQTLKQEILSGFPELHSFDTLPDVPSILLIAGKRRPPNWQKNLVDFYETKMAKLSESKSIILPQSTHYIQRNDPVMVIESIRRVVFPNAENILSKTLDEKGVDSCIALYKKLKSIYPKDLLREGVLNTLGYEILGQRDTKGAIALFSLNVAIYPQSYNTYDSLAEAYMDAGNKKEAIKNYRKSLALNPLNMNAEKMLKKLK